MRAVLYFGFAAVALAPVRAGAPSHADGPVCKVGEKLPPLVRRDLVAGAGGAGRAWVRAVRDLAEDRLDVDALPPTTPITVWTVGGDVVAFEIADRFAAPAQASGGGLRWSFDDGSTLDGPFLARPVRYMAVASRIGVRQHPITRRIRFHAGTDYAAPVGTPVHAAGDGVVTKWMRSWTGGRILIIKHDDGYETKYMHLSARADGIDEGVRVHEGQLIAYVGRTGRVTGPHLHFEIRDPWRTPLDSVVARWPGAARVGDAALEALRLRRDLLHTFLANGERDLDDPLTSPPSAVDDAPPVDDDGAGVVLPFAPVRTAERRARGPRRRRVRTTHPVFDEIDVTARDTLARRAIQLAAEFPDDPMPRLGQPPAAAAPRAEAV